MHKSFKEWLESWQQKHLTQAQRDANEDWLMGESDCDTKLTDQSDCDMKANTTTLHVIDREDVSPYYPYNRYKVQIHKEEQTVVKDVVEPDDFWSVSFVKDIELSEVFFVIKRDAEIC